MALDGSDRDAKDALSKLLQIVTMGTMEIKAYKFRRSLLISPYRRGQVLKLNLQHELLVSRPTTLGYAFSLARITEARFEAIVEKEQNIKEKANTTLSLPIEEVSPVVKGPLDASKDTYLSLRSEDINFKIQEKAVEYVRALNVAPHKVVFAGPVDEVSSVIEDVFDIDESNVEAYSPYHLEDKVNFEGVGNVTSWAAKVGRRKRVKCYVQGSGRRKRKKVIGHGSGRRSIKSAFQDKWCPIPIQPLTGSYQFTRTRVEQDEDAICENKKIWNIPLTKKF
ncbi:hypothetical protein Tco_1367082 [Tanacetum coccineum]